MMKRLLLLYILLMSVVACAQVNLSNPKQVKGVLPVVNGGSGSTSPSLLAGTCITITGSWPNQTITLTNGCGGGGSQVYPAAGVSVSTGSAWTTSLGFGVGANQLLQLNGSGQIPSTVFPASISSNTSGNAATATNLAGAVTLPGGVAGVTQLSGDSSTLLATDAFVHNVVNSLATGVISVNGSTGAVTITAGMIPNNNANTTGNAATATNLAGPVALPIGTTISNYVPTTTTVAGHALSSNVAISAADLVAGALPNGTTITGYVTSTTTVNGHALSTNVVVSASDLTTGTLPHAQLPTLLSGDIPNNTANTTGTASNVSGTPLLPNGTTAATQTTGDNTAALSTDAFVNASIAQIFNQNNTYASNAIQTFGVGASFSSLVLGSVNNFPCCSMSQGSLGMITSALSSGTLHMWMFDGVNTPVFITNFDSTCDMQGCTGTGLAVNQNNPTLIGPNLGDATGSSLSLNLATGDLFSLGPGAGFAISGSVTSGAFLKGETVVQGTTLATAILSGAPVGGAPMIILAGYSGTPDNSHTWVGQSSSAVYTPTSTPAVPYIQATPQAGFVKFGYGSDNRAQLSNNGGAFSDIIVASDPFSKFTGQILGLAQGGLGQSYSGGVLNTVPFEGWTGTSATQSGNLGSQTIIATTPASTTWYEIKFYVDQIAAGTSCTTNTGIRNTVTFTDPISSATTTLPVNTFSVSNNGTANTALSCGNASGVSCGGLLFPAKASTSVSIATVYTAGTGCAPGPTYQVSYLLEKK